MVKPYFRIPMYRFLLPVIFCAACFADSDSPDGAPASAPPDGTLQEIRLIRYGCGDNCYLTYVLPGEIQDTLQALCAAPVCGSWERWGELPDGLQNQRVLARFSTGRQYDGSGTVMREDFPAITEVRIGAAGE